MKSILLLVFFTFFAVIVLPAQNLNGQVQPLLTDSAALIVPDDSIKQVDLIDFVVKLIRVKNSEEKRDSSKVRFSLFPSASNISGGKTVVTSFNATFLLGDIATTNVSTVYFVPYIAFGGQYGFQLQPNIWLHRNSWNFTGEYFILRYPQNTWGLGGNSPEDDKTLIDYKHARIHQNALKGILPHLAIGLGYAFDKHRDIKVEENESGQIIKTYFPADRNYTISSGMTLPVIFDNRHNSVNPQQGFMGSLTYSFYHPYLGSDDKWQSLFLDLRKYFPIPGRKSKIIAVRGYYWTILSGDVPYLDLPANRWEPASGSASRGISQNRYRSNAILYYETEFRFGITANGLLGGVVFANSTSASQYDTQQFLYWHPAAGAGIRLKFNKYSRTNVTLDFGASKGFYSVYLSIGEAF
jgi:outer membrane protein assembly factor BamA